MSLRAVLVVLAVLVVALRFLLARQKRRRLALAAATRGHRCPECGARRVVAAQAIALAPGGDDQRSFELKALSCRACTFRGVAVHTGDAAARGHALDWQAHAAFTLAVDRCPAPADPACTCAAHRRFGARNEGRWVGLAQVTRDRVGFELG